jgi:hypothetical protein
MRSRASGESLLPFKQGRVNGAGFGFADTLALLAQVIQSDPYKGWMSGDQNLFTIG